LQVLHAEPAEVPSRPQKVESAENERSGFAAAFEPQTKKRLLLLIHTKFRSTVAIGTTTIGAFPHASTAAPLAAARVKVTTLNTFEVRVHELAYLLNIQHELLGLLHGGSIKQQLCLCARLREQALTQGIVYAEFASLQILHAEPARPVV
jgi:hypothetical protein